MMATIVLHCSHKGAKQSFPIIIFLPKRAMHGLMPPPKYDIDGYKNWETQRSSPERHTVPSSAVHGVILTWKYSR
jgi:hypothetical protein